MKRNMKKEPVSLKSVFEEIEKMKISVMSKNGALNI